MRLTELPLIEEINKTYLDLRRDGRSRADATNILIEEYTNEIAIGEEDDCVQFWIGLSDGQYQLKELTVEVAEKGMAALVQLGKMVPNITVGDIERRRNRYASAPMPERKIRIGTKFRCPWNIGDTFAYQISGTEAEKLGIAGKYMLFRKIDEREFGKGHIMPVVTVSMADNDPLSLTVTEFQSLPLLKIRNGGRCRSPENKFEYRTLIVFNSLKQLAAMPFKFVGNFQGIPLPKDEIIFQHGGEYTLLLPETIASSCCIFWKMHLYCSTGDDSACC